MTGSARLRDMVNQVETYEELEALLTKNDNRKQLTEMIQLCIIMKLRKYSKER